jgi:hypothetical protein
MSAFVTLPRGPVPVSLLMSTPCADAMRSATGVALESPLVAACCCSRGAGSPTSPVTGRGRRCWARPGGTRSGRHAARPRSPTAIRATTLPACTTSSASARISTIVPATGEGQLGVDLVGRDLDDALVDRDAVADLLEPFEDRALGDRLAHLRDGHVDHSALGW